MDGERTELSAGDEGAARPSEFPIIGIGASAGGLEALRDLLGASPPDSGMAFVIIQHLDPFHESMLAQLLTRSTEMRVRQIAGGERVRPDEVYIIPPGHGLLIEGRTLKLVEFEQPRGLRRPIDDFFDSLARDVGPDAGCVILSGTGADGTTGLRAIKEHGGVCIAQEPGSARYDGMPLSAVGTGLVDYVRHPDEIVASLREYFARRHAPKPDAEEASKVADHVDDLCRSLQEVVGHDFGGYKRSTVVRRIERRMQILGIAEAGDYLRRIRSDHDECDALFRDLLINVTRFFRDPEMFDALRREVIDPLFADLGHEGEVRVWIPGCSSGEEAYSIAMLLAEASELSGKRPFVQIFATDIDEHMLAIGREGLYPVSALADIPDRLRDRYTVGHGERFAVSHPVRDMVRFSNHSLVKDPPFSRLDLISCRNLLIYFGDKLQQNVLPIFHYALRPGGHLFLGPSESIGRYDDLFAPSDQRSRIFVRLPGQPLYPMTLPGGGSVRSSRVAGRRRTESRSYEDGASTRRIIERYAPAHMVLDEDGVIVSAQGRLSRYFEFPSTRGGVALAAGFARPGLREVLMPLLRQAQETRSRRVARDVEVQAELGTQRVNVILDPLPDGSLLAVFKDAAPFAFEADEDMIEMGPVEGTAQVLEEELRLLRHRLRTTVEELETANEELKSSNEEMMSMNEELQSTNEELTTVNDELKSKLDQLTVANADLKNFFDSTRLAVVVLDRDLRIRTFTDAVTSVLPLQPSDRGRPIGEVNSHLESGAYLEDAALAARGTPPPNRRLRSRSGERTYLLRTLSYRAMDGTLEGATLVFDDITEELRLEDTLATEQERLSLALRVARIGVWEYRADTGETFLDATERSLFGLPPDGSRDPSMDRMIELVDPRDRPTVESSLRRALSGEDDYEATFRVPIAGEGMRVLRGLGHMVGGEGSRRMIGVTYDVTAEWTQSEMRELALKEMNHRVKNLFAILASLLAQEAKTATDPRALARSMQDRIGALGRAHGLAVGADLDGTGGTPLRELADVVLAPYRAAPRAGLGDEDVLIARRQLTPLALILHELATNSTKYGAFAGEGAGMSLHWRREGDDVVLTWRESGASEAEGGRADGFGSTLMDVSARQLAGSMERIRSGDAYVAQLRFPMGFDGGQARSGGRG